MLPRDRRVRTAADFRDIRRSGVRAGRRHVVVTASVDPDATRSVEQNTVRTPRAGFVVSKAVGGAVVRNRVKRRLRAIMAQQLDRRIVADSGALIQVRALPAAAEADYATLESDVASALTQCLRRAGGEGRRREPVPPHQDGARP